MTHHFEWKDLHVNTLKQPASLCCLLVYLPPLLIDSSTIEWLLFNLSSNTSYWWQVILQSSSFWAHHIHDRLQGKVTYDPWCCRQHIEPFLNKFHDRFNRFYTESFCLEWKECSHWTFMCLQQDHVEKMLCILIDGLCLFTASVLNICQFSLSVYIPLWSMIWWYMCFNTDTFWTNLDGVGVQWKLK